MRRSAWRTAISASLLFEPRDLWIGVYWNRSEYGIFRLYICIVPMFPILFMKAPVHAQ